MNEVGTLPEGLRLHRLWIEGKPEGVRLDLPGADLRGTGFDGASIQVLRLDGLRYDACLYADGRVQYGCETHLRSEWDALHDRCAERYHDDEPAGYAAETRTLCALWDAGFEEECSKAESKKETHQ